MRNWPPWRPAQSSLRLLMCARCPGLRDSEISSKTYRKLGRFSRCSTPREQHPACARSCTLRAEGCQEHAPAGQNRLYIPEATTYVLRTQPGRRSRARRKSKVEALLRFSALPPTLEQKFRKTGHDNQCDRRNTCGNSIHNSLLADAVVTANASIIIIPSGKPVAAVEGYVRGPASRKLLRSCSFTAGSPGATLFSLPDFIHRSRRPTRSKRWSKDSTMNSSGW